MAGDLKTDLDKILADSRLNGATAGVIVRDAAVRRGAVRPQRGHAVTPASNNKIETSAAAFGILGTGYRFRTRMYSSARSNLYLKGTGDPTMGAADYDRLAADIAAKGIKKVPGDLVADDTWFECPTVNPRLGPHRLPVLLRRRGPTR